MASTWLEAPENLLCALCLSVFEKATILDCGHSFCRACLEEQDSVNSLVPWFHHDSALGYDELSCPCCSAITVLKDARVRGLLENITVNALASDFKCGRWQAVKRDSPQPRDENPPAVCEGIAAHDHCQQQSGPYQANMCSGETTKAVLRNHKMSAADTMIAVLKEITLPAGVRGMAPLSSDTVFVAYGKSTPSVESVSLRGDRVPQFTGVSSVRGFTILRDGRKVLSHGFNDEPVLKVYRADGTPTGLQWKCPRSAPALDRLPWPQPSRDQHNNVYAVNGTNEISVFQVGRENPKKVISTGEITHKQICITGDGTIVTASNTTPNAIHVYDREGTHRSSIAAQERGEYLSLAINRQDRVLIANFTPMSGILKLSVYKLTDFILVPESHFTELTLAPMKYSWSYLVCLTPQIVAFGTLGAKLYFIKLP